MTSPEKERGVFAVRIDHLIRTVHPKERDAYSLQELADLLNEEAGEKLFTRGYLSQLRNGDRGLPSYPRLVVLARFFGVPIAYFTDDEAAERVNAQLELLVTMRDTGIQQVAFRAAGLSPESLKAVLATIELARRAEGLDQKPPEEA